MTYHNFGMSYQIILAAALFFSSASASPMLWVGFNTQSPIQRYTTAGAPQGAFGPNGASGIALDGDWRAFVAQPSANDTLISAFDAGQDLLFSFDFTNGVDPNLTGFGSYIDDMTYGGNDTLWLAAFTGWIYHVDFTGAILSSFDTTHQNTGIATDGVSLYTTQGFDSGSIDVWSLGGSFKNTIFTQLTEGGGIGYSATDNTLWVGASDNLYQVSTGGTTLATLALSPSAFHDGLEVGSIFAPEPSTSATALFGSIIIAICACYRRRFFTCDSNE